MELEKLLVLLVRRGRTLGGRGLLELLLGRELLVGPELLVGRDRGLGPCPDAVGESTPALRARNPSELRARGPEGPFGRKR